MRLAGAALILLAVWAEAAPIHVPKKSVSLSRQFVVYCDDLALRLAVSGFAEETKGSVLGLLGLRDDWKVPIVINVHRRETNTPGRAPSQVAVFEIEEGFKVELAVELGADPREIQLRQQLTRAILLEIAYRDRPKVIRSGLSYLEPPSWMIEGLVQILQSRENNSDPTVFQALIRGEKLLPLEAFLTQRFDRLDATSRQLYAFYAMNFVQLIFELPNGREALVALLRNGAAEDDLTQALLKRFPTLSASDHSAEKWWSLGVARLAAGDRYKGLTIEETERRLVPLLSLRLTTGKNADPRTFALADFKIFLKNPQSRGALRQASSSLAALGANAHPLFRPIVHEYQQITADLSRGKAARIQKRLQAAAQYRELVIHRFEEIADYMNWFEATQMTTRSEAFDDYLKAASKAEAGAAPRTDTISRYLDEVARQFQ